MPHHGFTYEGTANGSMLVAVASQHSAIAERNRLLIDVALATALATLITNKS